jgi:hypothetical protein
LWRAVGREAKRRGLVFAGHVPERVSASEVIGSGQASIEHASPALPPMQGCCWPARARRTSCAASCSPSSPSVKDANADRAAAGAPDALQLAMFDMHDPARATVLFRRMVNEKVAFVPTLIRSQTLLPRARDDMMTDAPIQSIPAVMRAGWATARKRMLETISDERLHTMRGSRANRSPSSAGCTMPA